MAVFRRILPTLSPCTELISCILSTFSVELHCEILRSKLCLINSLFQAIASPKSASVLHTLCEVTDVGGAKSVSAVACGT